MTNAEIDRRFDLHKPKDEIDSKALDMLRAKVKDLAHAINDLCPSNREQSLAFTSLEQTIQWAIAAIVRPDIPTVMGKRSE